MAPVLEWIRPARPLRSEAVAGDVRGDVRMKRPTGQNRSLRMLLELGKSISFFLCILSLYWVMLSAFFVPGSRWQERLAACAVRVAVAGCFCFASGLLFAWRRDESREPGPSPISTLPMRLFFWCVSGMSTIFLLSWYIEEYYLPWARKS
jgi:hypothetical protein